MDWGHIVSGRESIQSSVARGVRRYFGVRWGLRFYIRMRRGDFVGEWAAFDICGRSRLVSVAGMVTGRARVSATKENSMSSV